MGIVGGVGVYIEKRKGVKREGSGNGEVLLIAQTRVNYSSLLPSHKNKAF